MHHRCITGQVSRALIGNDAFQEADTIGITLPVTKHNYLAMKRSGLGAVLKQSFHIVASGRPGPVVIDVPKDIQIETLNDQYLETVAIRGYKPVSRAPREQVEALAAAVSEARWPLFFVGGGMVISDSAPIFSKILEATGIPFVTSLMGIGVVDSKHPLNLGMIGMNGNIEANMALTACDLLVGLGVRFADAVSAKRPPSPGGILSAINECCPGALIATEVGQNQMWAT